jgi:hypothetical protein
MKLKLWARQSGYSKLLERSVLITMGRDGMKRARDEIAEQDVLKIGDRGAKRTLLACCVEERCRCWKMK